MNCLKGAFTKDDDLSGLKYHDWLNLLPIVLCVALEECLNEDVRATIYKTSSLIIISGTSASVHRDKSGLIQVDSTKLWTDSRDTFILLEHCEH